ncbi:MAG: amidophosphoribosyltransferase [Candidatus Thermoplasmatota archaeon]|nr:amidophosphoribosyltransferase [Candidatus Thermoplasmatota archaeon]
MDFQLQDYDPINGLKPSENCAVVGICGKDPVFFKIYTSLRTLQHRGQEASGVAIYDNGKINAIKVDGLVHEGFKPYIEKGLTPKGIVGIGHNRYSTAGMKNITGAGPFLISTAMGDMAISHNGEITNYEILRDELKELGVPFVTKTDTEVMLNLLARTIRQRGIKNGIKSSMEILQGAYSVALMIGERMYAIRDPKGFRPLILGKSGNDIIVASESAAIDVVGGKVIRDVQPGEVIEIFNGEITTLFTLRSQRISHCMFEYVYFARPDSIIDGTEVYNSRYQLGTNLAREAPAEADVVIPVPDSGRTQALSYASELKMEYSEGLFKNRYSERTFIMPGNMERDGAVKLKLNPIKSVVNGKRIVLVDDSIVRGTTMKRIVSLLRSFGAREIHVRIASPKIVAPCYFGVDMKTRDQFIALNKTDQQICDEVGADSLAYLSIEGLIKSIGMDKKSLCIGCLTGEYPVKILGEKEDVQTTLEF